jgi:hypothetical protein
MAISDFERCAAMSLTPEYGEEGLLGRDAAGVERPPSRLLPDEEQEEGELEREVGDREREERELLRLDPEDNELHAAGQVCERCGRVIAPAEDVQRLANGHFVHQVCPGR